MAHYRERGQWLKIGSSGYTKLQPTCKDQNPQIINGQGKERGKERRLHNMPIVEAQVIPERLQNAACFAMAHQTPEHRPNFYRKILHC
jgi:hypothetical protein